MMIIDIYCCRQKYLKAEEAKRQPKALTHRKYKSARTQMQKHATEHEKLTNLKAEVRESNRKSRELTATVRKPEEIEKKKVREREKGERNV